MRRGTFTIPLSAYNCIYSDKNVNLLLLRDVVSMWLLHTATRHCGRVCISRRLLLLLEYRVHVVATLRQISATDKSGECASFHLAPHRAVIGADGKEFSNQEAHGKFTHVFLPLFFMSTSLCRLCKCICSQESARCHMIFSSPPCKSKPILVMGHSKLRKETVVRLSTACGTRGHCTAF